MVTSLRRLCCAAAVLLALSGGVAHATTIVYQATWSGEEFGNQAMATGLITVDTSLLSNPGDNGNCTPGDPGCAITAISLTVVGASTGNGTFGTADFEDVNFWWNTTLNLFTEWVGQPQDLGGPWGTHEGEPDFDRQHDFNLFAVGPGIPNGTFFYELTTFGLEGGGDPMYLTSFRPVPEPATLLLLGTGLAVAGVQRRMKRRS